MLPPVDAFASGDKVPRTLPWPSLVAPDEEAGQHSRTVTWRFFSYTAGWPEPPMAADLFAAFRAAAAHALAARGDSDVVGRGHLRGTDAREVRGSLRNNWGPQITWHTTRRMPERLPAPQFGHVGSHCCRQKSSKRRARGPGILCGDPRAPQSSQTGVVLRALCPVDYGGPIAQRPCCTCRLPRTTKAWTSSRCTSCRTRRPTLG